MIQNNFMRRIKNIVFVIVGVVTSIIICILVLLLFHNSRDEENQVIIESFSRQQMLTQIMSKDAGRIYSLYQAADGETKKASLDIIQERYESAADSLSNASEEFSVNIEAMKTGTLLQEDTNIYVGRATRSSLDKIEELAAIWKEFQFEVSRLIEEGEMNEISLQALVYIQDHNLEMLALSDEILEDILRSTNESARLEEIIIYFMMSLLMSVLIYSFVSLYSYIVVPYRKLYQGFEQVGLVHTNSTLKEQRDPNPLVNEIGELFHKINDLFKLLENMNNNYTFTEMLDFIHSTFSEFISYNYIGIALIDKERQTIKASFGVSDGSVKGMPEELMGKVFSLKSTSLMAVIEEGNARIINDLEAYTQGMPVKYYNQAILSAGIKSSITLPLKRGDDPIGVIFFSSTQKHVYRQEHIILLKMLANSIAVSFEQNIFIDDLLYSNTLALAKLAEARDEDTGEHLERMKRYSSKIAEFLYTDGIYKDKVDLEYISKIERFSPLHDIGKVGVPDGILLKPGKLTKEEFEEMKKHTSYGAEVLRTAEQTISKHKKCLFGIGIEIAEGHQEKWDGSGYPLGKKGEEIPLSARIVAVADVLDALTSERPYKDAYPFEQSFQMMVEERGTHFDPLIMDSFIRHKEEIYAVYRGFQL